MRPPSGTSLCLGGLRWLQAAGCGGWFGPKRFGPGARAIGEGWTPRGNTRLLPPCRLKVAPGCCMYSQQSDQSAFFGGAAALMMELPRRHATPLEGGAGSHPISGQQSATLLRIRALPVRGRQAGLTAVIYFGPCASEGWSHAWHRAIPFLAPRPLGAGPARGPWTNVGRLPLRVFSIGKYAFQKKLGICVQSTLRLQSLIGMQPDVASGRCVQLRLSPTRLPRGHRKITRSNTKATSDQHSKKDQQIMQP